MFLRSLVLLWLFMSPVYASTQAEEYATLKGGFELVSGDGYLLVVDEGFDEVSADIGHFKEEYLSSDMVDDFCASLLAQKSMVGEVVPFRPTLTAYISSGVTAIGSEKVELYDTSLDVGYFWVNSEGIQGGVVLYHGFTKTYLASRFHKKFRIVFDRAFVERVTGMSAESILEKHLLKTQ